MNEPMIEMPVEMRLKPCACAPMTGSVDAAGAPLEDRAEAVDEEVVADVVPALGVAVVLRDREHDAGRLGRAVGVRALGVVDERRSSTVPKAGAARGDDAVPAPGRARDDRRLAAELGAVGGGGRLRADQRTGRRRTPRRARPRTGAPGGAARAAGARRHGPVQTGSVARSGAGAVGRVVAVLVQGEPARPGPAGAARAHVQVPASSARGSRDAEQDEAARAGAARGVRPPAPNGSGRDGEAAAARRGERRERVAAGAHERGGAGERAPSARAPRRVSGCREDGRRPSGGRLRAVDRSAVAMLAGTRRGRRRLRAALQAPDCRRRRTACVSVACDGGLTAPSASHCSPNDAHVVDDRQQRAALVRQRVLDARRDLGERLALDDARLLEVAQAQRQRARADPAERALELAEARVALREVADDEQRPLGADDVRGAADGTPRIDGHPFTLPSEVLNARGRRRPVSPRARCPSARRCRRRLADDGPPLRRLHEHPALPVNAICSVSPDERPIRFLALKSVFRLRAHARAPGDRGLRVGERRRRGDVEQDRRAVGQQRDPARCP